MPRNPRDYKVEYGQFHGKPSEIKKRAKRNKARKILGLGNGDGKEADHKVSLSKGGGNKKGNLRITTRRVNRKKYNK